MSENRKTVTYAESRREYFKSEHERLERKLNYWTSANRIKDKGWRDIDDKCSDIGAQMEYVEDAIWSIESNRHGKWIPCTLKRRFGEMVGAKCSECGEETIGLVDMIQKHEKYCRHCGARMDLEDVNETDRR